ncbi:MAG: NADH-quinone oxidoreductase subunit NuoH [Phycisphaerales bacterium]|nr:NADH-quinone oxidoreductase subunit NuoH [Phycisphaerales bacterium]
MTDPLLKRIETILRSPLTLVVVLIGLAVTPVALGWLAWPILKGWLSDQFSLSILVMGVMLFIIIHACAVCILAERKVAALMQDRHGPNRVGFWGWLQPIADGVKMAFKENINPANVDKPLFLLAPTLALCVSLLGFAIVPWGGPVQWPWAGPDGPVLQVQAANLNIGLLYFLAVGSIGVYAVVLAGYASNNKYAFYGGLRASAQMISYELPLGLALLVMLLTTGTLQLEVMVDQQARSGLWYVFLHPVAFFLVLVAALAETNRAPFDLAECEQELVGGYHTEYSGMKFGMFFLGEYAHMITNSAIIAGVFFGGWHFWGLPGADNLTWWAMLTRVGVYCAKVSFFIWLYMIIRWTIPRFRFDQLMRLCWQSLVPVGILMLIGTGVLVQLGLERNVLACLALNVVLVAYLLWRAARTERVTARQEDLPEIEVAARA